MPGAEAHPFQYAILRLVPRIDRGERLNLGVVLFCRQAGGFLAVRWAVDPERVRTFAPEIDAGALRRHLHALEEVAAGRASGGTLAALAPSDRFGWLVAPSSTIVQPSEVHTGICCDPPRQLDELFARLVS